MPVNPLITDQASTAPKAPSRRGHKKKPASQGSPPRRSSWYLVIAALLVLVVSQQLKAVEPSPGFSKSEQGSHARQSFIDPQAEVAKSRGLADTNRNTIAAPPARPRSESSFVGLEPSIQLDGVSSIVPKWLPTASLHDNSRPARSPSDNVPSDHVVHARRVQTMRLSGRLANWDRDPEADGWQVHLALLDSDGDPVRARGHATITLSPNAVVNHADAVRISNRRLHRWSRPLSFDINDVATMRLQAPASLKDQITAQRATVDRYGFRSSGRQGSFVPHQTFVPSANRWDSVLDDRYSHRSIPDRSFRRGARMAWPSGSWVSIGGGRYRLAPRGFAPSVDDWDPRAKSTGAGSAIPSHGHLTVRVSIPGQGVLTGETDVRIRPHVSTGQN
ncbi:MAG: hypothetical protein AAF989_02680 [Planctomycetota bacterium]